MAVRAVLWDVDDTLFDYRGANEDAALRHFAAEGSLGRFPSPQAALERWWAVTEEQYARFLAGELDFAGQRRERARAFLGRPLGDAEADRWFAGYTACFEAAWRLFPDVLPALDALAGSHRHAVLSNSSAPYQRRKLATLGIGDRFETVLCSEELGHAKPAAEAFHAACRALALPPRVRRVRRRPGGHRRRRGDRRGAVRGLAGPPRDGRRGGRGPRRAAGALPRRTARRARRGRGRGMIASQIVGRPANPEDTRGELA